MLSGKLSSGVVVSLIFSSGLLFAANPTRRPAADAAKDEAHFARRGAGLAEPRPQSSIESDYQELYDDLHYLDGYVRGGDLDEFVKAADWMKEKWSRRDQESYGRLMLSVSNTLVNSFRNWRAWRLSEKYASDALASADSFSVHLETELVQFLSQDFVPRVVTRDGPPDWGKDRSDKAKLWLHALRRLEQETDINFDFSDRPYLNIPPPQETGLPSGVAPEAIKDPWLRAQYEAAIQANAEKARKYNHQFMMRHLNETFTRRAERYLIGTYAKPPFAVDELKRLLDANLKDVGRKERILSGVRKKMAERAAPRTSSR